MVVFRVVWLLFNILGLRQNGRHFPDNIFKCIFLTENVRISIKISQKFVPRFRINNIPALVQIMAWRRPGNKPLSGPMMVSLLMHICITWPQWVNYRDMLLRLLSKFYQIFEFHFIFPYIDGLVPERCNSSALAMELHLSCTHPLLCLQMDGINSELLLFLFLKSVLISWYELCANKLK